MAAFNSVSEAVLQALSAVLPPANLSTAESERQLRSHDMSHHPARLSEVVVWPETAEQTAAILQIANELRRQSPRVPPLSPPRTTATKPV